MYYRPVSAGGLELSGNIFLAPVAGWTDRVFRGLCVEAGADFAFTELVSSEALYRGGGQSLNLLRRAENEKLYAIQLFGAKPDVMARAAARVLEYVPALIDINAGCPVPKVTKTGAGSALMLEPKRLADVVAAVVREAGIVPVSVKLRSGWDGAHINYEECARAACDSGAVMISLHPRSRAQGYEGKSDWTHIARLAAALDVPVCGSGDLYSPEDALAMLKETGCAAVMFARGAMGNPFIFSQTHALLADGGYSIPSAREKFNMAMRHLEALAYELGEARAALEMRKVFCAYIKGINGAAALRSALVHAGSIEEYRTLIQPFLCR